MHKKVISLVLSISMIVSLTPVPGFAASGGREFSDVSGHWSESSVSRWSGYGVVNGDIDGTFRPDSSITRAEFAQIACNLLNLKDKSGAGTFSDVGASEWYADAVAKASDAGVMNGYEDGTFRPSGTITRQEAMVALGRALVIYDEGSTAQSLSRFSDASSVADWASPYVAMLTSKGFVSGMPDGTVAPTAEITRAETVTILSNSICAYTNTNNSSINVNSAGTVSAMSDSNTSDKADKADKADKGITLAAADNVTINGSTPDNILLSQGAGGTAVINAEVNGEVIGLGSADISISESGKVSGDVSGPGNIQNKGAVNGIIFSGAGTVTNDGTAGEILTASGNIVNNGTVNGNITSESGSVTNSRGAVVNGDVSSSAGTVTNNGSITGSITAGGGTSGGNNNNSGTSGRSSGGGGGGGGSSSRNQVYVLMNIPYDEFYAAELGSDDQAVDAVSSATKNKPRTMGLAGGSYHVNSDGTDITGVIYPVRVSSSALSGLKEITDESSVEITVTNRGQETTTVYTGSEALFESPSYSYYRLSETPALYKSASLNSDGSFTFSTITGDSETIEGVTGNVSVEARHANVEIVLSGTSVTDSEGNVTGGIAQGDTVSGVVLTAGDGTKYGLRHIVNIWRGTELGWNYDEMNLLGKTITNIRYITQDAVYDYPVDIAIPAAGNYGYVLMNIPYSDFYAAAGVTNTDVDYDAITTATNKAGNYGKAGGAYHTGKTADIGADGTVTAVGGENGAQIRGVIWPVMAYDLNALKALGGTEITDDSKVTTATLGRGQSSYTELIGYETITEAPAYSYYALDSAPGAYLKLTFNNGTPVFSAGSGRAAAEETIAPGVSYGTNWGDVQLDLSAAEDTADKLINAVVVTAEDSEGNKTVAGFTHLINVWSSGDMAWRVAQIEGLDGKKITNVRYYCTVKDDDTTDNIVPEYVNYIYDYPMEVDITPVYTGTVSAEFSKDGRTVTLSGLPADVINPKAKIYHTTGGRNAVYTYLTPLVADPADDDIDPVFVDVTDNKVSIVSGSVTNNAGTTETYGEPIADTTYTIELSSDNYIINKITVQYTAVSDEDTLKGEATVQTFNYIAKVAIAIDSQGKITSVTDNGTVPGSSNQSYWNNAWSGMSERLKGKASGDIDGIDAVSGATLASNAIKSAVKAAFANAGSETGESAYVLMNIPYSDFYKAELGSGDMEADAVTAATAKAYNIGVVAGSYHGTEDETYSSTDILGITYPVYVSDDSILKSGPYKEISSENAEEALFSAGDYAYVRLGADEIPNAFKTLTVEGGKPSFGAVSESSKSLDGVNSELKLLTRRADYEVDLKGDGSSAITDSTVIGVVLTAEKNGRTSHYALRHLENIWNGIELAFCTGHSETIKDGAVTPVNDDYAALEESKITRIRYYLKGQDGSYSVYDIAADIEVPSYPTAEFADGNTLKLKGLTEAELKTVSERQETSKRYVDYTVSVYTGSGDNKTYLAEKKPVSAEGIVSLDSAPVSGTEYAVELIAVRTNKESGTVDDELLYISTAAKAGESGGSEERELSGEATVQTFGYTAKITLKVDSEGNIVSVSDNGTEAGTNAGWWNDALSGMKEKLKGRTESTIDNVDAVTGATFASNAIKEAAKNAFSGNSSGGGGGSARTAVADGTYEGTAHIATDYLNYMIDVDVTVRDGKVVGIEDNTLEAPMSSKDRELYSSAIAKISADIADEKPDAVSFKRADTVTGATISSSGISQAVNDALDNKKKASSETYTIYAPEGISLYAVDYPVVKVRNSRIADIEIVPAAGRSEADAGVLEDFASQIVSIQSVQGLSYPDAAKDEAFSIANLVDQVLYNSGVLR